jgi:hypothetical protein
MNLEENHRKQVKRNKNIVKSSKHEANQWNMTKKNDRISWNLRKMKFA